MHALPRQTCMRLSFACTQNNANCVTEPQLFQWRLCSSRYYKDTRGGAGTVRLRLQPQTQTLSSNRELANASPTGIAMHRPTRIRPHGTWSLVQLVVCTHDQVPAHNMQCCNTASPKPKYHHGHVANTAQAQNTTITCQTQTLRGHVRWCPGTRLLSQACTHVHA